MKSRLLSILFLVLCLLFAFVFGAQQGWRKDYAAVEETRAALSDQINTRAETACNILTVASRHLDGKDANIATLIEIRDTLRGNASFADKAAANERLTTEAEQLLQKLSSLETVRQDDRDTMYVSSMLPRMLRESATQTIQSAYNTAARDFNERFAKNKVSSFIATQFGIDPFELFGAAE